MNEKLALRSPSALDLGAAARDLVTTRCAPPVVISAAGVFLLTGNLVTSLLAVGVTSYLGAVWSRLLKPE